MSVNKNRPHIFVLPEDDANRQLANGFFLDHSLWNRRRRFQVLALDHSLWNRRRRFQVLAEAGGWRRVLECFQSDHIQEWNVFRIAS
jgi:hypothetical protein